ncbi:predicted protein [Plenodomus lingam JN3]|uniref:Predicted protein n=1 Tax=Leptosphaeria maculans (strain JN3 / isolate v23.1.3 / race Av1-4-5-6-7-8) TaxID=985895 RepID=E4ZQG1_LEPMJ|nr:predicted protein [Plenodomus lingam JN3]CBX93636.1 predicted protein [Plenodomus lingam JN3]
MYGQKVPIPRLGMDVFMLAQPKARAQVDAETHYILLDDAPQTQKSACV